MTNNGFEPNEKIYNNKKQRQKSLSEPGIKPGIFATAV